MFCSVSIESLLLQSLSIINKDEMSSASLAEKYFNSSITHKSQIQYTDFFISLLFVNYCLDVAISIQ